MMNRSVRLFIALCLLLAALAASWHAVPAAVAQPACSLSGTIYRDYDASGTRGPREPAVAGITVTAYGADGSVLASTTSGASGQYTLAGLPEGQEVRVEFTGLPSYLRNGPAGTQNPTSVSFFTCAPGVAPIDFGVANPGQYCQPNPDLATSCYVIGYQLNAADDVVVSFPYNSGSTDFTSPLDGRFDGPHPPLAAANQVGTTWGLTYHRTTTTLFAGAFVKRHTGLGPGGPGAIYRIDVNSGAVGVFTTLNAGVDPHPQDAGGPWLIDSATYDAVGKVGLGGLSISDDGRTLWVINLFDRTLNRIDVIGSSPAAPPTPGALASFPVPTPGNCPAADVRPFAVQYNDGLVYVGMVCSGETSGAGNLRGYVYSFNPANSTYALRFEFPLTYDRRCTNNAGNLVTCPTNFPADWFPWRTTFGGFFPAGATDVPIVYPQPWFTDIEFDGPDMIIGLRDRFGDQMGNLAFNTDPTQDGNLLYNGITAGDILRACDNGAGGWTLESNGSCGGTTTAGQGNAQGPGGGEFYYEEDLPLRHDEVFMGGLYQFPGDTTVAGTYFDPIRIANNTSVLFDGGVRWENNLTGQTSRAYRIFNGEFGQPPLFGKANGLGDLEALCEPAPIEIGNRVWYDADQNGVQDAGERSLAGVTVRLYDASGNLVATTITGPNGEYFFNNGNVPGGLRFNTRYTIRLDNPADYAPGGPLDGLLLTTPNVGGDSRDSDGVMINGFPTVDLTVGDAGDNNHTYDFGFNELGAQVLPTSTPAPGDTPPGGPGTPGGQTVAQGGTLVGSSVFNKTVDPPFAQPGTVVTWTITATNPTTATVTNVTVEDDMPAGFEILAVTASSGTATFSGQRVTVLISSLGPSQTVTITVRTRMLDNAAFVVQNSAQLSSPDLDGQLARAQVVRAGELVATGETPWWRWVLLAMIAGLVITAGALLVRRRSRPG